MGKFSKESDDDFQKCGPHHLKTVDWSNPEHGRTIAASLIQGVYVAEKDHQEKRREDEKLAPFWWKSFDFESIETLIDKKDTSIYGIIFKYKPQNKHNIAHKNVAPKYVVAFRGTLLKLRSWRQDVKIDLKLFINKLSRDSRYHIAKQAVEGIIKKEDPKDTPIWLVGHSLGAAIALETGKDMAKTGCFIETFLFNPPYISPISQVLEELRIPYIKQVARTTRSLVLYGADRVVSKITKRDTHEKRESFTSLHSWMPHLFLNPKDRICRKYIGYFEHRKNMVSIGLRKIESTVTRISLTSMLMDAFRKGSSNSEVLRSIPSAIVTKNMKIVEDHTHHSDRGLSHALCQWWESHSCWESQAYQFYKKGDVLRIGNDEVKE